MIDRSGGEITFHCDQCADFMETEERDWDAAQAMFRSNGWKARKIGPEWVHLCPACAED